MRELEEAKIPLSKGEGLVIISSLFAVRLEWHLLSIYNLVDRDVLYSTIQLCQFFS